MTTFAAIKTTVHIQDVIASLFKRSLYKTARPHELKCRCWRTDHSPDTRPSNRIDTRKQVFFCDVCGSGGDVITVVREHLGGASFRTATEWLAEHRRLIQPAQILPAPAVSQTATPYAQSRSMRGPRTTYQYHSDDGTLLFRKLRTPDKRFFYQHRSNGQWVWGLGDVEPVLYRLPDIYGRRYVLVVEGEKDVDAAWDHELPATTNPEGAGNGKWKPHYTRQLLTAGVRHVYVIPDNDDVGRLHAEQIVAACRQERLRAWLVPLPGVPPHGDLSDYFEGHTRMDVLRLLRRSR